MNLKINKIILVLTFLLCIGFVSAFEVNITQPSVDDSFGDELSLLNVTVGGNTVNCTYDIDSGTLTGSINDTANPFWEDIDTSLLIDGDYDLNVTCFLFDNASDINSTMMLLNINRTAPSVVWHFPQDDEEIFLGEEIELRVNATAPLFELDKPGTFIVSCDNGDNGSLSGDLTYLVDQSGIPKIANITQTWTAPAVESLCTIIANVTSQQGTDNSTEVVMFNVTIDGYINSPGVEFDNNFSTSIGDEDAYNLTNLLVSVNSSREFSFNMTHGGICMGTDPISWPASLSTDEGDFWEAAPPSYECIINFSNILEGENLLIFDFFLNDSELTTEFNYSVYYDPTLPEIHFEWWNASFLNETTGEIYYEVFPDYKDLLDEDDIFFAPNDEIFIAINATDAAQFNGTIDRAYANFTDLDLGQVGLTCDEQVDLTYNETSELWEGNCSLGDFSSFVNSTTLEDGFVTFIVYDAYDNWNEYEDYNISNSSQVCEVDSDACAGFEVPIILYNLDELEATDEDDCVRFDGLTTDLNAVEDFTDVNLIIDMYINLSCEYEDDFFPSNFERMIMLNFSSVDLTNPSSVNKLMKLFDALDFEFSLPDEYGKSLIYVNSTAFAELNTDTVISMYHLPMSMEPTIEAENPSHFNDTSVNWVSNGPDELYSYEYESGNLTFNVFGFSGYDIYDNESPVIDITYPVSNPYETNEENITFEVDINGTGSFVQFANFVIDETTYSYIYDGINSANCTNSTATNETIKCTFTHIGLEDGDYQLNVIAGDFGGDEGLNETETLNISINTVAPNATIVSAPVWAEENFVNFTFIGYDDVSAEVDYDFWIVNATNTSQDVDGSFIYNTTTVGQLTTLVMNLTDTIDAEQYTWFLKVQDQAGNYVTYNGSFAMDQSDPSSTVSGNHSTSWQYEAYDVTITATDAASGVDYIYYEIDDNGIIPINSNTTTFEINESGEYNVTFWSTDVAGNTESNNTFLVKLDQADPVTTVSGNYSIWKNIDYTVTLSADDEGQGVNQTYYNINNTGIKNGTSIEINESGEYNVSFWSTDLAGRNETPKLFVVKLDKIKPVSSNTSALVYNGTTQNSDFNVTVTATDEGGSGVATTYYRYNNAEEEEELVNGVIMFNESGQFNFSYWSEDVAGNEETIQRYTVILDKTAPTTTDDSSSYSRWENEDFNITLTPEDTLSGVNNTYYKINEGSFTNGTEIVFTSEGDYNVSYYSIDNSGNNETENTFSIGLDKTAPTATDNSASFSGMQNESFNVTITVVEILSGLDYINYTINDGANQTLSGTEISFTSEGEYNVTYYAVDNAGNVGNEGNFTVSLDNTAPVTTDDAPTGWQTANFTITLDANDGLTGVSHTSYSVNDSTLTNGTSIEIGDEGEYNVTYYSVDNAGNIENTNTILVQLDKTAPTATDNSASYSELQNEAFNVTITAIDAISGIDYINYTINGSSNMTLASNVISFTSEGEYNVTYYAVDNAGHLSTEGNFSVSLDNTAPVTTDDAPTGWQTVNFTITLDANDGLTGVSHTSYSVNDGTLTNGTSIEIGDEGEYNVTYYSVDNAGNIESTNTILVQLDKTAPTLNITAPTNSTYTSSTVTLTTTATDSLSDVNTSSCIYSLDGNATYGTCPSSLTDLTDGSHTLIVNISDNADNMVSSNVVFSVQEDPSYSNIKVKLPIEYNETNNYWFNITLTDNSAVDLGRLNLNGTWHDMTDRGSGLWTYNETNLTSGTYSYYYWTNDTSNNTWTSATSSFTIRALETYEEVINESDFEVPVNVTNVIVDELQNVSIPSGSTATVTLDLSNTVSNGEVTLDNPVNLKREGSTVNYSVEIPAGTKLNASSSWDGKLIMPEVDTSVSATEAPSGKNGTVDLTLKVGSDDVEISFDKPVKILLQGQANKSAAWKRGSSALTEITTTCDSATNPTNINSVNPRICKVNSGSDLVIWTYHFTTFASGTWSTTPSTPTSSGGGGSRDDTYEVGKLKVGESIGQKLAKGDDIEFSLSNGNHNLRLSGIDYTNRQITVKIQSDPKIIDMDEFVVYRVDTDDNGVYDLKTWFEFVTNSKARVYLMEIEEKVEEDASISPVQKVETEVPPETKPENIDVITNDDSSNNVDTQDDFVMEDNTVKDNIAVEEETNWGVIITVILVLLGIIGLVIYMLYNK